MSAATASPKAKQRFKGIAMDVDNSLALVNTKLVIYLDDEKITTITTDENGHFDIVLPYGETNNVMRFETKGSFDYNSETVQLNNINASDDVREVKFGESYRTPMKKNKLSRKQKRGLKKYTKNFRYKNKKRKKSDRRWHRNWTTL